MFNRSVLTIKGIGDKKAKALNKLGISTVMDLLEHYPKRYDDFSKPSRIAGLNSGEHGVFLARVISSEKTYSASGKAMIKFELADDDASITAIFMNSPYMSKLLKSGVIYWFHGEITLAGRKLCVFHPEFCEYKKSPEGFGIRPVYPLSGGIKQGDLINALTSCRDLIPLVNETLPKSVVSSANLVARSEALSLIHFPNNISDTIRARRRLVFEEMYNVQVSLLLAKKAIRMNPRICTYKVLELENVFSMFPFDLTSSQKEVIGEIFSDLYSEYTMNRLVFGDVGSGKTVVAIAAAIAAIKSGYQVAVMAPTEILARQHFDVFSKFLAKDISLDLLLSAVKDKKDVLSNVSQGKTDILIGTHALIQSSVEFKALQIVITDEQHRFGVTQRSALKDKALEVPDILALSATPIPRTLSMALYGDLDISYLTDMPSGRKAIITRYIPNAEKLALVDEIREHLLNGERAYFVAPRIEDDEAADLHSAELMYDGLKKIYKNFNVGLLHGKMSQDEKFSIMSDFKNGLIQILVATSVIEVGIDVKEASIIVISDADRFGLSQLHQLRGRVGRGERQGYCFLTGDISKGTSKSRIDAMVNENSGFKLAEIDLQLRGAGQVLGTRQHGFEKFKIADYARDYDVIKEARSIAEDYLDSLGEHELITLIESYHQNHYLG